MQFQDEKEVALLLTAHLKATEGIGRLSPREFWSIRKKIPDLRQLLDASTESLRTTLPEIPNLAERVVRLLSLSELFAEEREQLAREGLHLHSAIEESFPSRLRLRLAAACPPALLVAGQMNLAACSGIGVVGSRHVSEEGANVARAAGLAAAQRGFTVVSGGAKGVDSIATLAALDAGGTSIAIPSEGLRRVLKRGNTDISNFLFVSPLSPDAAFNVGNAMGRNKVIYALAHKTLVVASDDSKGGTWQGATEALRKNYGAVVVWRGNGQGTGNLGLEQRGGQRITDIDELFSEAPTEPVQLGLDLN